MFIYGVKRGDIGNFNFRYYNSSDHRVFFCKCIENPVGYLQVVHTVFLRLDVVHYPVIFDHV